MSQLTPSVEHGEAAIGVPDTAFVRRGDRVFRWLTTGSGVFVVVLIAAVAIFLVSKAIPSLRHNHVNFLTSREWQVGSDADLRFGIAALLWTTLLSSVAALVLAVPVGVAVALYITHYAPARVARPLGYLVDLLAAVPSIIYGLWGIQVLAPRLSPLSSWLQDHLGWFPLFRKTTIGGTVFVAAVVLAIMILPIITAISREVFAQVPTANIEGALALGATRWEMIRVAVLPFGRPGVISASMLGLGRALGETIAVLIILGSTTSNRFNPSLFADGDTFAKRIARSAGEFDTPLKTGAFIAAGLVLFIITFLVNATARIVVNRRKDFA